MHTGVISFCDRVGYNIKSSDVKDLILNELDAKYHLRVLQKHWMRVDAQQLKYITSTPHTMCLRSNGNPYYMYFTRYDDTNTIFFVDKKVHPGYEKPRILLARGRFADEVFRNTVLDGEMVKDTYGQWIFLINDVLTYEGRALVDEPHAARLRRGYDLFDQKYCPDPCMDVCIYQLKQYLPVSQRHMEQLIDLNHRLPYTNRGIYFYPSSMKYKPKLYNFNEELIKSVTRQVKDNPEFRMGGGAAISPSAQRPGAGAAAQPLRLPEKPPVYESSASDDESMASEGSGTAAAAPDTLPAPLLEEGERVLFLRKTENPDIYEVYPSNFLQNKMGVACVPSLAVSRALRQHFRDRTVATLSPWTCTYNPKFQKWQPKQDLS